MDDIRIIHTGDTHLGYRQYHSDVRRQDFFDAFSAVVDDAISMDADAVVHAGDLFDSRNPTLDDILDAMGLFSRLKNAGIPLLAIVGNHESKQSTQWLDLYGSLGLVTRLGARAYRLGEVALYGIDSVPKTKIPLFDYSVFRDKGTDARYNLLVMHQLVKPFSFGEWDIKEVIDSLPFKLHAVLLGDNHKQETVKVDGVWVTYSGSTERNSTSEREPRSYNIVTVRDSGIEISKKVIPTRDFVFIPVTLAEGSDAHEELFSRVMEYDIEGKVVFVEISGDARPKLDFSETERFLLSKGALIPGIKDLRTGADTLSDQALKITFCDPDDVVRGEIKKMDLTAGGLLLDDIIRDPLIVKTRVGDETEARLGQLLDDVDFSGSIPARPVSVNVSHETEEIDDDQLMKHAGQREEKNVSSGGGSDEGIDDGPDMLVTEQPHAYSGETSGEETDPTEHKGAVSHEKEQITGKKEGADKAAVNEKESSAEKKAGHDAAKPRQYNLGDYL